MHATGGEGPLFSASDNAANPATSGSHTELGGCRESQQRKQLVLVPLSLAPFSII